MNVLYDKKASKKATNISLNSDLVRKAKLYGINLSQTLEVALERIVKEKEEKQWRKENRTAIEVQNRRVEKEGAFSDEFRRF
ncbi:type II toxin-antitoxin system CcdA family antitoxin [Nitratifractor salsuginis]|uniref:Post-segregation antitoxin CcdA n=1 Tax=Nitratifractor salsuginis (strain DSM 16511 / JCM 12458 / E9I37-1) TaxID=749222 RepID=E6X2R7_NITSE|nr:type II toxin-antitoxin system CcdA family antitoxin [Nitratifractor salsuginis]ADV46133.1 post-segregation antitoxin CcdA [Nitratifractor salsuginis DSM 16511]